MKPKKVSVNIRTVPKNLTWDSTKPKVPVTMENGLMNTENTGSSISKHIGKNKKVSADPW